MSRAVASFMRQPVWSVGPDQTLEAIGREFAARGLHWAPVVEGASTLLGVLSAWDLVRLQAQGQPASTPAWKACTYRPLTIGPDTPVGEAAELMRTRNVHHLPVVAADGRLLGIVSSLDLLSGCADNTDLV